ncbi:hypothetical protein ABG775_21000 [Peribacillus simplex]
MNSAALLVSLGSLLVNFVFTREFRRFTREFGQFTRKFCGFTREFGVYS